MQADWYYQVMGQVIGPLSLDELQRTLAEKRLDADTLVRNGRDGDWMLADRLPKNRAAKPSIPRPQSKPPVPGQTASMPRPPAVPKGQQIGPPAMDNSPNAAVGNSSVRQQKAVVRGSISGGRILLVLGGILIIVGVLIYIKISGEDAKDNALSQAIGDALGRYKPPKETSRTPAYFFGGLGAIFFALGLASWPRSGSS